MCFPHLFYIPPWPVIMEVDLETRLNSALCHNKDDEVIKLCSMSADGPLHKCSIHNCTVLHKATYLKKFQLANELFDHMPENLLRRLTDQRNDWGNTILHNASTSNSGILFLGKLLKEVPRLLQVRNNWGETAVFQATRYGKRKAFEFLAGEVERFCDLHKDVDHLHFFQRDDNTTILHMAILTRNFDMALMIARKYQDLCGVRALDRITALQLLACSPEAFRSGTKMGFLKEFAYSRVSTDDPGRSVNEIGQTIGLMQKAITFILPTGKPFCSLPIVEEVRVVKKHHEDVIKLAKILIRLDTSWRDTHKPHAEITPVVIGTNSIPRDKFGDEGYPKNETSELRSTRIGSGNGGNSSVDSSYQQPDYDIESGKITNGGGVSSPDETPLILAARKGCVEIVEETLNIFSQALDYLNHDQQNVLHVAIKSRNLNVFKLVEQLLPVRDRMGDIDNKGNSILHMVATPREVLVDAKMKNPVLQLSEDLLLLEYLKEKCPSCLVNHRNNQMKTADELFAINNEKLRIEAKDWLKRTAEHCTVVIVLIATVAFAAAYTIPGGPNQATGYPLLLGQPFFLVFTVTDVLSLGFALTAVVIFLAILTSSFQLKDFRRSLPQKLLMGFTLLFLSVSMMMVAFAATIILMISNRERWTKIAVYIVAFFPVCIFVLSYIPLYIQLVDTFRYWVKKISKSLPRSACATS